MLPGCRLAALRLRLWHRPIPTARGGGRPLWAGSRRGQGYAVRLRGHERWRGNSAEGQLAPCGSDHRVPRRRRPDREPINGDQVVAQAQPAAPLAAKVTHGETPGGMTFTRTVQADESGKPTVEQWVLHGAGHAWAGGSSDGSYTDPRGPDASREMLRFFLQHHAALSPVPERGQSEPPPKTPRAMRGRSPLPSQSAEWWMGSLGNTATGCARERHLDSAAPLVEISDAVTDRAHRGELLMRPSSRGSLLLDGRRPLGDR